MNRTEVVTTLAAIARRLDTRVEIWKVVLNPDGTIVRRIYRGSFTAPPDWRPPTFETLVRLARNRRDE